MALRWIAWALALAFIVGLGVQQWRMGCDFNLLRFGVPVRCMLSAAWSVWPLALVSCAGAAMLAWLDRKPTG